MAERNWFYIDSTNQEFGPFGSTTMRTWFQQGFFPMQGELKVRLEDMPPDQHYHIKDLYPGPIMERAFDGEPNLPNDNRGGGGGGRSGGRRGNGAGGGGAGDRRNQAPVAEPAPNPYDINAALMAAQYGMPGMPGMGGMGMASAGMPGMMPAGMAGLGFPGMWPGHHEAMMQGMGGLGGMPIMPSGNGRFQGRIKSFNVQKGFGFIECAEAHQIYGRDVFLHKAQIETFQTGSLVSFAVEMNKTNFPQARDLTEIDNMMGGMMGGMGGMAFAGAGMGMAGKGGYTQQKGGANGGKGKAAGGKNNNTNKPKGGGGGGGKGGDKKKKDGEVGDKKPAGVPKKQQTPGPIDNPAP